MSSLAPFILLLQMFIPYKYFGRTAWYPGCVVRIDEKIDIGVIRIIQKRYNIFFTVGDACSFKVCTLL